MESFVSSAISTVASLMSLVVEISAVLRSSDTFTAESLASLLTLVTVLSALLLVSTAPSFIDSTESLASLLILIAASFISLNISPKLKSACALVNSAATATHDSKVFFIFLSFVFF